MPTHAIIAKAQKKRVRDPYDEEDYLFGGRFVYFDGFPTVLGRAIWKLTNERLGSNVDQAFEYLIEQHTGGWYSFEDPDNPVCYCHPRTMEIRRDNRGSRGMLTEVTALQELCEWAYVLYPYCRCMLIYRAMIGGKPRTPDLSWQTPGELAVAEVGIRSGGDEPAPYWELWSVIHFDGHEPNWEMVEQASTIIHNLR